MATRSDRRGDIEPSKPLLEDPIQENPRWKQVSSFVAVAGHPIHAMSVAFPVALTFCTLGADLFYWWTGELFWARAAYWAAGTAFIFGVLAGLAGTVELLMVPGIRARAACWTHFIIAMTLLALLGANWGHRFSGFEDAVLPWGLALSVLSTAFVAFTGWHGGKLVFDYQIGMRVDEDG